MTTDAMGASTKGLMARVLAIVIAAIVVSVIVVAGSRAAFTSSTANSGNLLATGDLDLIDDGAAAMFTVSNMVPGQIATECILVTRQGSIVDPSAVKLYTGGYNDPDGLDAHLTIKIDEGTGATYGDCSGFTLENVIVATQTLALFDATYIDYGSGAGVWDPSSTPESKAYRFTFTLDSATPDTMQGKTLDTLVFNWEIQS